MPVRESVALKARDDMDMQVKDELSGRTVIVDADVDAVRPDSALDLRCK